ncbi:START domain-containing protein [Opitutales bacterium]|nr:START domain-containing protein [Opitutales bacterium]
MIFRKIGFFLFALWASISFLLGEKIAWGKIKAEKGVTVYKADVQGRVAFRGVGEMTGSPEDLVSIIEDPSGWKNWIENFKSGKLIEEINPEHKIFYQAINSPFPVSDRDVVFESRIIRDSPDKIRMEMKSVTHPKAPKTIGTRINIIFTRYSIEKINQNKIAVTFETLSHPGGALPDFLVNWASESYPVTLLNGLAVQLKNLNKKKK